jgi:hypothetical protein
MGPSRSFQNLLLLLLPLALALCSAAVRTPVACLLLPLRLVSLRFGSDGLS